MNTRFQRNLFLSLIMVMAIAPTVFTLWIRDYFLDTNAIGRSTFIIQELETEHRKVNALLYKVQGFGEVDAEEIKSTAIAALKQCEDATQANWYSHDSSYKAMQATLQNYCDVTKSRVTLFDDYDDETESLVTALDKLPAIVRTFDNDKNEGPIEDTERLVSAYAVQPSHDAYARITLNLKSLNEPEYKGFKKAASTILIHANKRLEIMDNLTDPAPLIILARAKQIHFDSVVSHDIRGTLTREILTYLSLVFGLVIVVIYWNLQKTGEKLARLNRTLEEKVDERTSALQKALEQLADQQSYLAQSAKMSALGEMAGGIAHEINTPLAAISLTAELLQAEAEDQKNPQFAEGLSTITTIVERIAKIVQGLKRFSRGNDDIEHTPVPVSQILDDTFLLCSEKLKARGIRFEVARNDGNTNLLCAPEQISQVLINLLNNSVDAIDGQNTGRKWIHIETQDHQGVFTLKVSDGGDAIKPDVRAKLMQPFFTTKQIGKGTGLGLSISKGIMLSHQGTLEFDPRAKATTFVMTMPSMTSAQAHQANAPTRSA